MRENSLASPPSSPTDAPDLSDLTAPAVERSGDRRFLLWALVALAVYVFGYALAYLQTPLGGWPVLDARENIDLARSIADGSFAGQPFYRAMLYPALLAALLKLGISAADLPTAATLLGGIFHLVSAGLVSATARRVWGGVWPARTALLAYGLNPVLVYHAGQRQDTALGLLLFCAGLLAVVSARRNLLRIGRSWIPYAVISGVLLGLAVSARPNYLIAAVALPVLLALAGRGSIRSRLSFLGLSASGLAAVLLLQGLVQLAASSEFRILPWQGAYNLWAANRPGSSARFYSQQIDLGLKPGSHTNPALIESLHIYARDSGKSGPFLIEEMNSYWRKRFVAEALESPLSLAERLFKKAYYSINGYEQYNNFTYAFHRERNPWLKLNPVGWTLLVSVAAAAWVLATGSWKNRSIWLAAGLASAVPLVLFFPSSRFRVALVPLVTVAAAGLAAPGLVRRASRHPRSLALGGVCAIAAGATAASGFWSARDRSTDIQDISLIAIAASELRRDREALVYAEEGLAWQPGRFDLRQTVITSLLNLYLDDQASGDDHARLRHHLIEWASSSGPPDPLVDMLLAAMDLAAGRSSAAELRLRRIAARQDPWAQRAVAALVLAGVATPQELERFAELPQDDWMVAAARNRLASPHSARVSETGPSRFARLFTSPAANLLRSD
jgi:hypothetical protein